MQKRKRSEHYVNNKEFLEAIVKYKNDVAELQRKVNRNHVLLITLVSVS